MMEQSDYKEFKKINNTECRGFTADLINQIWILNIDNRCRYVIFTEQLMAD